MKAIQFEQYGSPAVLKINEIDKPIPQAGQVLVRIKAFSINPIDWKLRRGDMRAFFPLEFPYTPGAEFAGIIDDITDYKVGDRVYGRAQKTYAEYIVVDTQNIQIIPPFLDFAQAASLPSGSQVAYSALKTVGNIEKDQKILIHAGAGGVGIAAIQIAKYFGAHVTTTASEKNIKLVKSLGADVVFNYNDTNLSKISEKYDLILDSIGGQTQVDSWELLNEHGTLVSLVSDEQKNFRTIYPTQKFFFMRGVQGNPAHIINELIIERKIKPVIDQIYGFKDIDQAHTRSETGHVSGKLVVQL